MTKNEHKFRFVGRVLKDKFALGSSNVSLILPAGTVNNTSVIGTGNATTGTIANVSDISNSNATIPGNLVNVLTMGSVVNNNTAASGTGKAAPATANKSRGALGKKR